MAATAPAEISRLFTPVALGSLELANRTAVAPMTRTSATPDGLATARMASYYADYARGGFALVITEGAYPDQLASQGYLDQPGIATDAHAEAWSHVVDAVHAEGGKIVLQLMHAGPIAQGNSYGFTPGGPSAVQPLGEQLSIYRGNGAFPVPREMTLEEINAIPGIFADAALRARAAGFDGVEAHGANGYLLDSFLSTTSNHRTDAYGGPVANRIRLSCEVVAAIRAAVGPDYPVGIRISQSKVNDFDYTWPGGVADAEVVFPALAAAGASFLHITEHDCTQQVFGSDETLAGLARQLGGLPTIVNGGLDDPRTATVVLARGDADAVSIGKAALANQDWASRARDGRAMALFDFEMLLPFAKLEIADAWRAARG